MIRHIDIAFGMKGFILLVWFLGLSMGGLAQFEVEWIKEMGNDPLNSIQFFGNNLYFSCKNSFGRLKSNSEFAYKSGLGSAWIKNIDLHKSNLLVVGDPTSGIFDHSGTLIVKKDFCWPDSSSLSIQSGQLLNNCIYLLSSYELILKYDVNGTQSWSKAVATGANNQKILVSDNHLYIYTVVYNSSEGGILKYDTLGQRIWRVDPGMFVADIVTDEQGNLFVLGSTLGGQCLVTKLNKAGERMWTVETPGLGANGGFVRGDSLFLCGLVPLTVPAGEATGDDRLAAYGIISSKDGSQYEYHAFNLFPGNEFPEQFTHITANENSIYVGGFYGMQFKTAFIAKFSDPRYVSVNENKLQSSGIKVFPNPARDEISVNLINWSPDNKVLIKLRDQLGRVIVEQYSENSSLGGNQYQIKAPGAKGIYLLTVSDGGNSFTEKVIFD